MVIRFHRETKFWLKNIIYEGSNTWDRPWKMGSSKGREYFHRASKGTTEGQKKKVQNESRK